MNAEWYEVLAIANMLGLIIFTIIFGVKADRHEGNIKALVTAANLQSVINKVFSDKLSSSADEDGEYLLVSVDPKTGDVSVKPLDEEDSNEQTETD